MRLIVAPLAAAAAALVLTPVVGRLARKYGAVDHPDERHAHQHPTPTCGGVAIFVAFWIALIVLTWPPTGTVLALLAASTFLLAVSIADDLRGLSWAFRLTAQVALAVGLWWVGGVRIAGVTWPFGSDGPQYLDLGNASLPLTVAWIVVIVNALNWLDGLDGLAAGVAAIEATALCVMAWGMGAVEVGVVGGALAGAALGFLPYNVKPARIFMGDSGSMFLGLVLACMAVAGTFKAATAVTIMGTLLVMGVPLYDVVSTSIKRILGGKPVHAADRQHLHHRLLGRGWSEERVVMVLWGVAGMLSVVAFVMLR